MAPTEARVAKPERSGAAAVVPRPLYTLQFCVW